MQLVLLNDFCWVTNFSLLSTVLRSHRKRAASPPVPPTHIHDPPPRTPPKSGAPEVSLSEIHYMSIQDPVVQRADKVSQWIKIDR